MYYAPTAAKYLFKFPDVGYSMNYIVERLYTHLCHFVTEFILWFLKAKCYKTTGFNHVLQWKKLAPCQGCNLEGRGINDSNQYATTYTQKSANRVHWYFFTHAKFWAQITIMMPRDCRFGFKMPSTASVSDISSLNDFRDSTKPGEIKQPSLVINICAC